MNPEPCPFCECAVIMPVEWQNNDGDRFLSFQCTKCKARGPRKELWCDAVSAWNCRANQPTPPKP